MHGLHRTSAPPGFLSVQTWVLSPGCPIRSTFDRSVIPCISDAPRRDMHGLHRMGAPPGFLSVQTWVLSPGCPTRLTFDRSVIPLHKRHSCRDMHGLRRLPKRPQHPLAQTISQLFRREQAPALPSKCAPDDIADGLSRRQPLQSGDSIGQSTAKRTREKTCFVGVGASTTRRY